MYYNVLTQPSKYHYYFRESWRIWGSDSEIKHLSVYSTISENQLFHDYEAI